MTTQPEALRLAEVLEYDHNMSYASASMWQAAAELRRLHALNIELLEVLTRLADWAEQIRASGDAGFWDWNEGDEYMQARATIAKAKSEKKNPGVL